MNQQIYENKDGNSLLEVILQGELEIDIKCGQNLPSISKTKQARMQLIFDLVISVP